MRDTQAEVAAGRADLRRQAFLAGRLGRQIGDVEVVVRHVQRRVVELPGRHVIGQRDRGQPRDTVGCLVRIGIRPGARFRRHRQCDAGSVQAAVVGRRVIAQRNRPAVAGGDRRRMAVAVVRIAHPVAVAVADFAGQQIDRRARVRQCAAAHRRHRAFDVDVEAVGDAVARGHDEAFVLRAGQGDAAERVDVAGGPGRCTAVVRILQRWIRRIEPQQFLLALARDNDLVARPDLRRVHAATDARREILAAARLLRAGPQRNIPAIHRIERAVDIRHLDIPVRQAAVGIPRTAARIEQLVADQRGDRIAPAQLHRQRAVAGDIDVDVAERRLAGIQRHLITEQFGTQRRHLLGRAQALVVFDIDRHFAGTAALHEGGRNGDAGVGRWGGGLGRQRRGNEREEKP